MPGNKDSKSDEDALSTLEADTLSPNSEPKLQRSLAPVPTLTVAHHPDPNRIGEQSVLGKDAASWQIEVSRLAPDFFDAGGRVVGPLRHRFVSRQAFAIRVTPKNVTIETPIPLKVEGEPVHEHATLPLEKLQHGVLIELTGGVLLILKMQRAATPVRFGLHGLSDAIASLRQEIERAGPQDTSVLIQGETGVGKELIARALHQCSKRSRQPFVAVNMGALPKDTAAAELLGYKKGAFTGAVADHPGYFGLAEGGTLFLDEIGETAEAAQPVLLRALENHEVQSLGSSKVKTINVRVIAATDANLEAMMGSGKFRSALFHRLGGYSIQAPALRNRVEDIPVLFLEFLRQELERAGKIALLSGEREDSWLRASLMSQLLSHSWPGNVRELRNVTNQVVAFSADLPRAAFPPAFASLGAARASETPAPPPKGSERPQRPSDITSDQLIAALKHNGWSIAATARSLAIAKNSLYDLIESCPNIRKARDLSTEEIAHAQHRHPKDLDAVAGELQVSLRALQLRMKELGLR